MEESLLKAIRAPGENDARMVLLDWAEGHAPEKAAALRADLDLDPLHPTPSAWEAARQAFAAVDPNWLSLAAQRYRLTSPGSVGRERGATIPAVFSLRWFRDIGLQDALAAFDQDDVCWADGVDATVAAAMRVCPVLPFPMQITRTQSTHRDPERRRTIRVSRSLAADSAVRALPPRPKGADWHENTVELEFSLSRCAIALLHLRILEHPVSIGEVVQDATRLPW